MMTRPGEHKKLTVCAYLSGARPEKAFAVLEALFKTPGFGTRWDLIVGIDCISYDLAQLTHLEHRNSNKTVFIETKAELGKEHFLFAMVANIRSQYVLLCDDEVSLAKDWITQLEEFLRDKKPEGISGAAIYGVTKPVGSPEKQEVFLHDSAVLLNTAYLRRYEVSSESFVARHDCTLFDERVTVGLGLDRAPMRPFQSKALQLSYGLLGRESPVDGLAPLLSSCMCTYGDHPELILRCVDSILREPLFSKDMEILIGCNNVSERVMGEIEQRYARDRITAVIRSPVNFNKSGMQRFTFRLSRGAYLLSLDDDMYFKSEWFHLMKDFVVKHHPFEAAGRLHALSTRLGWSGKKKPYHEFVERKKWWRDKTPHDDQVHFPAGQCFVARRSFVIENDYPDLAMKIDWDDVLLGDMVTQLDGRQLFFSEELYQRIIVDEIASRGQHGGG